MLSLRQNMSRCHSGLQMSILTLSDCETHFANRQIFYSVQIMLFIMVGATAK